MLVLAWKAQPLCLAALLTLQLFEGLIPLALAFVSKYIFDILAHVLRGGSFPQVMQGLIFLLILQAAIVLVRQFTAPLREYLQAELGRHLTLAIRYSLYHKLNSLAGLAHFEDPGLHNSLQVVGSRVQFAPMQALQMFVTVVQSFISLASFFGILIALSPVLAVVLLVAVVPHFLVQLRLSRQQFRLFIDTSSQERRASYYGQVLSWVEYAKEIRLFGIGDYFLRRFIDATKLIYRAQHRFQLKELRLQGALALLSSVTGTAAFVMVVWQTFSGHISLGEMVFYIQAVESVQNTLLTLSFSLSRFNEDILYYRQYTQILALSDRIVHPPAPQPVPLLEHGITFRNVWFRYSEQHPWIVRDLNLFLPAGKCLALVGLNGAGKTTLVKLLTRLYDPTEGEILWDDLDIRQFDPVQYRRHLGAIFQDFARYDLSAQENIGLGEANQIENLSAIQAAARKAGVHERIEVLPQGYQSILSRWLADEADDETGDSGVDLSGGEWQKLALARMFLREAQVIILDEPTASLDAAAEYDLFEQFRSLMRGQTSLLITHRFSTVRMADHVAVLEQGQISEYGTHDQLLADDRTYARLYRMQAENYLPSSANLREI
jgi:ATP-binding cassette subfamily B protein